MRPVSSEDLYLMKWVQDPQISPDGTKVLFEVKTVTDQGKLRSYKTQIYIATWIKPRQKCTSLRQVRATIFAPGGHLRGKGSFSV